MNKLDTILWAERLREAIRVLPPDANIFGYELRYDCATNGKILSIHLSAPVDWSPVVCVHQFSGWKEMQIVVTPYAVAWWAKNDEGDDDGQST